MTFADLKKRILDQRIRYVIVNIIIAALVFSRNLVFMRVLKLSDLGQVALAQTIIMLVAFLQFGLINGGYRIYASRDREENKKVNNLIITYIGFLIVLSVLLGLTGMTLPIKSGIYPKTLYFGIAAGLATLASNWMNNCLIADERLGLSNGINLFSAFVSLFFVLFPSNKSVELALWSLLIQPICVFVLTLTLHKLARPTGIWFSLKTLRHILSLGFVPFTGGLLALMSLQLERWSIISNLGAEQLGRFYIIILYSSIFTLVPASLLNVYYPNAIRRYEEGDIHSLLSILKRHSIDLFRYILMAVIVTCLFMKLAIVIFLPKFMDTMHLVFLALPGFIVTSMCDVLALYYNAVKRLKPLLYFGLFGLGLYAISLQMIHKMGSFSLISVVIARSSTAVIAGALLYLMYHLDLHDRRVKQ